MYVYSAVFWCDRVFCFMCFRESISINGETVAHASWFIDATRHTAWVAAPVGFCGFLAWFEVRFLVLPVAMAACHFRKSFLGENSSRKTEQIAIPRGTAVGRRVTIEFAPKTATSKGKFHTARCYYGLLPLENRSFFGKKTWNSLIPRGKRVGGRRYVCKEDLR